MDNLILNQKIVNRIFENSIKSAEKMTGYLENLTVREKDIMTQVITFEFMYLFLHLISRSLYGWYGKNFRKNKLAQLGPIIINPTVETFFGSESQKVKENIIDIFYDELNTRELEYGVYRELLIKNKEFTGDAVLSLFAKKIAEIMKSDSNPEILARSIELAVSSWTEIRDLLPVPTGLCVE